MGFLAPPAALLLAGGVLNEGGAALGTLPLVGPPVDMGGIFGAELIRGGGILLGFNPANGGAIGLAAGGFGVVALGGGGVAATAGFVSFYVQFF